MPNPTLTLALLVSALQVQGADATITSDNKGVNDLLQPIRSQLHKGPVVDAPLVREAAANSYTRGSYTKSHYGKGHYLKGYYMENLKHGNGLKGPPPGMVQHGNPVSAPNVAPGTPPPTSPRGDRGHR
jgi:hypothetical protein